MAWKCWQAAKAKKPNTYGPLYCHTRFFFWFLFVLSLFTPFIQGTNMFFLPLHWFGFMCWNMSFAARLFFLHAFVTFNRNIAKVNSEIWIFESEFLFGSHYIRLMITNTRTHTWDNSRFFAHCEQILEAFTRISGEIHKNKWSNIWIPSTTLSMNIRIHHSINTQ